MTRKRIREDRRITDSKIINAVDSELWVYHTVIFFRTYIRSAWTLDFTAGDLPILQDDIGW